MFDDIFSTLNDWSSSESDAVGEELAHTTTPELDNDIASDGGESFDFGDSVSDDPNDSYEDATDISFWNSNWEYAADTGWDSSQFNGWGNPIEDANCWQQQEGQNSCAVVAQMGVYESITGVALSEAEVCQIAEANGWFDPEIGTYPPDIGKILNELGVPTEQSYDATLDDIATALEQGDKVIVGLDANETWNPIRDPATGSPIEQSNGGHAVWVTGIDQKPDGSVKIILNDSGIPNGQMKAVDAEDFLNAWEDYGNFLVVADAPKQPVYA